MKILSMVGWVIVFIAFCFVFMLLGFNIITVTLAIICLLILTGIDAYRIIRKNKRLQTEYQIKTDDGRVLITTDLQELIIWVKEGKVKPHNQVWHTIFYKLMYIKDMAELEEVLKKD